VAVYEAIGEARDIFENKLSKVMKDCLEINTQTETGSFVAFTLIMMGKSVERTKPIVMFCVRRQGCETRSTTHCQGKRNYE
jgi:hypothetical protein